MDDPRRWSAIVIARIITLLNDAWTRFYNHPHLERWSWIAGIVGAVIAVAAWLASAPSPSVVADHGGVNVVGSTNVTVQTGVGVDVLVSRFNEESKKNGAEIKRLEETAAARDRENAELRRTLEALTKEAAERTGPPGLAEVLARVKKGGDPGEIERLLTGFADRRATEGRTAALEAAKAYRQAATLAQWRDTKSARALIVKATEATPDDAELWIERGRIEFQSGDLSAAQTSARRARSAAEAAGDERTVSVARNDLGNALMAAGKREEALAEYRAFLAIAQALAETDPGNAEWRRDLSVSHERIGDALTAAGKREEALGEYRAALTIRQALAETDPGNTTWRRDLSVSHIKIGDALTAAGKREEALAEYRADLAIAQALAETDPGNAEWKRDLSVSHEKIGDALTAAGRREEALAEYRAALAIAQALAETDPGNAEWKRDLSVSHNKIGDALTAAGKREEALAEYRKSLTIRQALAETDPGNAEWKRDLVVSFVKLASLSEPREAREWYERALTIADGMSAAGTLAPVDAHVPGRLRELIAEAKAAGG